MMPRDSKGPKTSPPHAIRGWLIPIGIGLILYGLRLVVFVGEDLVPVFSPDIWAALTTHASPAYHWLNAPVLINELAGNLLLVLAVLVLMVLFVRKHPWFPRATVGVLLGALVFYMADYMISRQIPAVASQEESLPQFDIMGAVVVCGVLIPYLLTSKRVKETFVR
jgi:hypothetical protein